MDPALPGASAPARSRTRTRSRPSTTSSSARRSSSGRGSTSAASSSCPRTGSYFTKEIHAARTSIIVVRAADGELRAFHNICRHRGNKLVWEDYPGEETSGTCRQFVCKYHGWRYALDGELTFVQQESEFFDLDKAELRPRAGAGRRLGGVHLREPRPRQHRAAARLPRQVRRRDGGLPVRRDDPGLQVPGRRRQQLEALHRRLRRVLPRTRAAREAVRRRRVPQAHGLRLRGPALRARRSARDGVVVGRHGAAQGPEHGQADRADPAQRQLRAVGPPRHPRARSAAARAQPVPPPDVGPRLATSSSRTSWCWCGRRAGTSRTTTGRPPTTGTSSRARCTSSRRKTARDRMRQELAAVTFKEFGLQDCNTLEATQTMLESRVVSQLPAQRPGDPAPPPPQDGRRVRRRVRGQRDAPHATRRVRSRSGGR